jgi:L-ascorbate metabolism protein UlaG (beta-lactamase superfamily)
VNEPDDGSGTCAVTFVGTATTVLRLGAFTVLTDPNFLHAGQRAYLGYGLWSRRRTEPALGVTDLPPLDAVVLSHLHGDHFDRVARTNLPARVPIVTTRQARRRLAAWGFSAVTGLSTWGSTELHRDGQVLRVTAVPAQHGPALAHRLLPPTMGSVIDVERDGRRLIRLYITGDTLYRPRLAEIGHRFPDIDSTLMHLGGTRILGVLLTMDGRQGVETMSAVPSATTVPIHLDDYGVFRSGLDDFMREVDRRGFGGRVRVVARGETAPLRGTE